MPLSVKRSAPTKPNELTALEVFKKDIVRIRSNTRRQVKDTPPIFTIDGVSVFFRNTINIVQGKKGTHKSRIIQNFIAAAIAPKEVSKESFLNIECLLDDPQILYIDTERNIVSQLPAANRHIYRTAGLSSKSSIQNYTCASLINIPRSERLILVKEYIREWRSTTDSKSHLLVFADVFTDFISDFNSAPAAFDFIDFMNSMADQHNTTIIGVIHENPSNEKARGHLGTELENKCSTVLQIKRFDSDNEGRPVFQLGFVKLREDELPQSRYVKFCKERMNLILTDSPDRERITDLNPKDRLIRDILVSELSGVERKKLSDLKHIIMDVTDMADDTIGKKLSKWRQSGMVFTTDDGKMVLQSGKTRNEVFYWFSDCMDEDEGSLN